MPTHQTSRTSSDISLGWATKHPDLLGKMVLRLLEEHPLEEWDINITKAFHPGMAYSFNAVRKPVEVQEPVRRTYRNYIHGFDGRDDANCKVYAQMLHPGLDVVVWLPTAPTPDLDAIPGDMSDEAREIYVEIRNNSPAYITGVTLTNTSQQL